MEEVDRIFHKRPDSLKKRNEIIKNADHPVDMEINGFLAAAEDGDLKAQHQLALIYIQGEAVPQNFAEALDRKSVV